MTFRQCFTYRQTWAFAFGKFMTLSLIHIYTSKSGDVDYEGRTGAAALWLSTLTEKCEAGEILYDLRIKENHAADEHKDVYKRQEHRYPAC